MLQINADEKEALRVVARLMCLAARTAPKARGVDQIVTAIIADESEKEALAQEMERLAEELQAPFFSRDAQNLRQAALCVLIGTRLDRRGLPGCGLCGFDDCTANEAAGGRCAVCLGDLGIALGSAAAVAADCRADNRMMFSIGQAARRLGILGEEVAIVIGIPLAATGKNIFFDRK